MTRPIASPWCFGNLGQKKFKKPLSSKGLKLERRSIQMKHTLVNTPEKGFSLEATEDIKDPLSPAKPSLIIDLAAKTVDIFIIGIKSLSKYFDCSACGKKAEQSVNKLLKCGSCHLKQRLTKDKERCFAKLFVEDLTNKKKI